jgi:hypothetical protein
MGLTMKNLRREGNVPVSATGAVETVGFILLK